MCLECQRGFRYAAAGLIKSLIRARATQEPNFLSPDAFERWGVSDYADETRECAQLLRRVSQLHAKFEREFLNSQDSIPSPEVAAEEDAFDRVVDDVASFIYGDLNQAIRVAAKGEPVRWSELAAWDNLPRIRDALDRLPEGSRPLAGTAEQNADGPVAPNQFVFEGVSHEIPAGVVYHLIETLWYAKNRRETYEDLAEPVWKDDAKYTSRGHILRFLECLET